MSTPPTNTKRLPVTNIGIGCFHFSINKVVPFEFSYSEYFEELTETLNRIPNITNIQINHFEDDLVLEKVVTVNQEITPISESQGLFPLLTSSEISFEVFIPLRIQKEIIGFDTFLGEKFKVILCSCYDMPVTFIQVISPKEADSTKASFAVRIIREFLTKQINSENGPIKFESLGPSPFHCDIQLIPSSKIAKSTQFEVKRLESRGYDKLIVSFNSDIFQNPSDAFNTWKESAKDELDIFYYSIQIRSVLISSWVKLENGLENLKNKSKGFFSTIYWIFSIEKDLQNLFMIIAEMEMTYIFSNEAIQNRISSLYIKDSLEYFKKDVSHSINEDRKYPLERVEKILNYYQGKNTNNRSNLINLTSAIVGGIVGGVITSFFKF